MATARPERPRLDAPVAGRPAAAALLPGLAGSQGDCALAIMALDSVDLRSHAGEAPLPHPRSPAALPRRARPRAHSGRRAGRGLLGLDLGTPTDRGGGGA
jgi:hypothetical protein